MPYTASGNDVILAIDIGTTKVKVGLIRAEDLETVSKAGENARILYPKKGWAEQDPLKLWEQIIRLSSSLPLEKYKVRAVAFSAHLAGVIPVNEKGDPLRNMIIWIDERATGLPKDIWSGPIKFSGYNIFRLIEFIRVTGGAPGYSGKDPISKLVWIRDFEPEIFKRTRFFLGITGYLVFKATGKATISPDDASLTWLADTRNRKAIWHEGLLRRYGIPKEKLPPILDSTKIAGKMKKDIAKEIGLENEVPVIVGAGDLTTAAIGSGSVKEKEMHIYIGTSNWIGAHTTNRILDISNYIGSIMSAIPGRYLLVAEQEVAAGALEWLMKNLSIESKYDVVNNEIKDSPPGSNGIIFAPWMFGERAPIDDPNVRGIFFHLDLSHTRGDLLRAVMEGISYNIRWVYEPMERLTYLHKVINVVGGGMIFDEWCKILASVLKRKIARIRNPQDSTLRGAAMISLVGLGYFDSFEEASQRVKVEKVFKPRKEWAEIYDKMFNIYRKMYKRLRDLFKEMNIKSL